MNDREDARFLPFSLPDIGPEEIDEVVDTLKSGWVTTGPKARRFEEDFARFIGSGVTALAVNSATAGLHLALEAAGIGPGNCVIVPVYTFTATAEVVRYLGADPVFVDIDPDTFNIDPDRIEEAIVSHRTSNVSRITAVIPVHFAGLGCAMDRIGAIADLHGLKVIEDAAHALPATFGGRMVGSLGSNATVFSFYANKTITTGEGGMIVTTNEELAERCRVMRLHGISRDAFDRYRTRTPSWYYEVVAPGFKYNMPDIAAALGLRQLRKAWRFQKRRAELAAVYDAAFRDLPLDLPPKPPEGDVHAWHLYVIRLKNSARIGRDRFIEKMSEQGIGCSVHFIPLHLHPYWRDRYGLQPGDFPNALHAYEAAVSLPLFSKMSDADLERVIGAVRSILS